MKEFVKYIISNACYLWNKRNNISIKPTHIIIHSTATPGVMANKWYERWNKSSIKVAVHAFIDDKEFWQLLPFNMWAWGVGGKANGYSLQIEMCEDKGYSEDYFRKVLANTITKVAQWCKQFNIPVANVIGHYEAHLKGIGSNHGDPRHWWKKVGYTMDMFRADVQKAINGPVIVDKGKPFDEKVCKENLNVRYGPGTNFKVLATYPKGTKVNPLYLANGWWSIAVPLSVDKRGYAFVHADYLSKTSPIQPVKKQGIVSATRGLNVRSGPSTGYARVGTLKHNEQVTIYTERSGWYRIGTDRWASAKFIKE